MIEILKCTKIQVRRVGHGRREKERGQCLCTRWKIFVEQDRERKKSEIPGLGADAQAKGRWHRGEGNMEEEGENLMPTCMYK